MRLNRQFIGKFNIPTQFPWQFTNMVYIPVCNLYITRDVICRMQYVGDEILFQALHEMPFRVLYETDLTLIKSMTIIILSERCVLCHPTRLHINISNFHVPAMFMCSIGGNQ